MQKLIELKPQLGTPSEWDAIEKRIRAVFRKEIYQPLIKEFSGHKLKFTNALYGLNEALQAGTVQYWQGRFSGKFNSKISKELKALGAKWDRQTSTWKLLKKDLPLESRMAISASRTQFDKKISRIDAILAKILPEEIADKIKVSELFDASLFKIDRNFQSSLRKITVAPQLTPERRKFIADEWEANLKLYIKGWVGDEVLQLRQKVKKSVFAGNRYENLIGHIVKSYGVSVNKAKFLARQETSLATAKFRSVRYQDAGVDWYKWGCVSGSAKHPVRPWHRSLEGRAFRWDDPPVTTEPGTASRKNNPHEDFNCRCFAIPLVNYKGRKGDKVK